MAQIWMDEENAGVHMLPRSARKLMGDTMLQKSGKKCVLGKLDNVLHHNYNNNNKQGMTPTSKMTLPQKWPMSCAPKLSLCKETLQKQHRKQISKFTTQGAGGALSSFSHGAAAHDLYARSADENDKFDLFDYMDFPSEQCLKNCQKPISNVWSKPLLSDDLIDQLVHNVVSEEEKYPQEFAIHLDSEDEGYEELIPPQHEETECDEQLDDISVELPASIEFDDFDFF